MCFDVPMAMQVHQFLGGDKKLPISSTDSHGFSQRFHGRKFLSLFDDGAGLFAR